MLGNLHDMVERTMEVFMDDFSVFGNSFQNCLSRLDHMLQRCEDTNLSLNWEKSHFMVKEGIVLGHKISKKGIELSKPKIDVIAKNTSITTTVKGIRSFLGCQGEIAPMGSPPPDFDSKLLNTKGARTRSRTSVQIGKPLYETVNDPNEINDSLPLER
ncbi:hypothetical protein Tco_1109259 [Tanacetum coccineum]